MESLLPLITQWIFGMPPSELRWPHVAILFVLTIPTLSVAVARVLMHRQRIAFLRRATREQIEAYKKDPPPPPGMAGPLILLALLGVGVMAGSAPKPEAVPVSATLAPSPLMCLPDTPLRVDSDEERTCCRGRCEPGSRCNERTCKCEANAQAPEAASPKPTQTQSRTHLAKTGPLEADLLSPLDWDPSAGQVRWNY